MKRARIIELSAVLWLGGAAVVHAADTGTLPTGGQVIAGSGQISQSGNQLTVTQSSDRLIASWSTFNIGSDASVRFEQPSSSSVALNRILDANPSQIFGNLSANGRVFLLNPNGIFFGSSAQVNVGGLVASSLDLTNDDFLAGRYTFSNSGNAGRVENRGTLNAPGGVVALIAPQTSNLGAIKTEAGSAILAAGDKITLDFQGDGLVTVNVDKGAFDALAENQGLIQADGGRILMTADSANALLATVVNNDGVLQAHSLQNHNGRIVLDGGDSGLTRAAGTLDVSGADASGGQIVVTGDHVLVDEGSRLDATGTLGGGEIYVGGGGHGDDPAIHQATTTEIAASAVLDASAINKGNGGTIVVWSDVANPDSTTNAHGSLLANAGPNGGDGGFIETSGHAVDFSGVSISTTAAKGTDGNWLIDPSNLIIGSSGAAALGSALNSSSVTVTTSSTAYGTNSGSTGNIIVNSAIAKNAAGTTTLKLQADQDVILNADITSTTGTLNVELSPNSSNAGSGAVLAYGNISTNGGYVKFNSYNGNAGYGTGTYFGGSSAQSVITNGGAVDFYGDVMLANTNGLTITTTGSSNGAVTFHGKLDSGDTYSFVNNAVTWTTALASAKSGTGGNVGDTYLATITSALENNVAGATAGYAQAWLGARRVVGIGTDAVWRWVAGPEGLQNNGNGLSFFTQNGSATVNGSGGAAINGAYTNWSSGEPNNFGGANLSVETESVLQFTGTQGKWNDLPKSSSTLPYIVETNLATSPVAINAGTATVTFGGQVGGNKALASLNVTASTIAINGGAVTTEGVQTYTGNITLGSASTVLTQTNANTDFTLLGNKSIGNASGGDAALTIKTTRDIVLTDSSSISSSNGKLNVTLDADSDGNHDGAIALGDAVSISTNGGNIVLGGGANPLTTPAYGSSANPDGVVGFNAANPWSGLGGAHLNAGGGTITINGYGSTGHIGVDFNVSDVVSTSGSGTITVNGTGSGSGIGVVLDRSTISAQNGSISITGTTSSSSQWAVTYVAGNSMTVSGSGAINVTGIGGWGVDLSSLAIGGSSDTGNITFTADGLSFNNSTVQSTGTLSIAPYTPSTPIGIAGGSGTLSLLASNFSTNFVSGFSNIIIGNSSAGAIAVGAATTLRDNTTFISGGNISINGALSASGKTLTLTGGSGSTVSGNGNIVASSLLLNGANSIYALNTASANSIGTLASSGATSVNFKDSGSFSVGSVNGVSGVSAGGSVTLEANGSSSDLTLNNSVTSANGDIVLAAGRNFINNTATNSGINPGTGRYLVYSTSPASTTEGMTGYSKHYNQTYSAGSAPGYATSGNWFLYSIAPILSVTPGTATVTYGNAPTFTPGYSGFIDGDTTSTAGISGTVNFSIGGGVSGAGYATAGVHDVSYSGGLMSSLGYTFQDNSSSINELTVNRLGLSVTGVAASNRVYDATTAAALAGIASVTGLTGDSVTVTGPGVGIFADKNVGTGKAVTVSGYTLSGADASNYTLVEPIGLTANVTPDSLTISGLTANSKVYDTTTNATLSGTAAIAALGSDTVILTGSGSAAFADKNVGSNKAVSVSGYSLSGGDAGNYTLAQPAGLTASITPASLTISGLTANSKVYDTTTAAILSGTPTITALGNDVLSISGTGVGTFSDKNVGLNKAVTVSGYALTGADAGNYVLVEPTGLNADIGPATLLITGLTANNKVYDATTSATLSGTAMVSALGSDNVVLTGSSSAAFASKNVGSGNAVTVSGYTLSGSDAGNYTLVEPPGLTANITPAPLAVTGISANDKVYDATTLATLTGSASVSPIGGDQVALSGTGLGTFADKSVGTGKSVTVTGYTLTGSDAGNYQIEQPAGLTSNITPATVALVGLTAANKPYDGSTTDTVASFGALQGVIGSDFVSLDTGSTRASFSDPQIGSGKTVTITGLTLTGRDAGNYVLADRSATTANITNNASVGTVTTTLLTATGVNGTADTADGAGISGPSLNVIRPGTGPQAIAEVGAQHLVIDTATPASTTPTTSVSCSSERNEHSSSRCQGTTH